MDVFRALGNQNRVRILKLLMKESKYVSALAKELGISVPVALRHASVLEDSGFVEKSKVGNLHFLKLRPETASSLRKAWGLFEKPLIVEVQNGSSMLDALKKVSGIKFEHQKNGVLISEVDGKKGYYLYEVNGRLPHESADKFIISKNYTVELKLLQPVVGKKIMLKVK